MANQGPSNYDENRRIAGESSVSRAADPASRDEDSGIVNVAPADLNVAKRNMERVYNAAADIVHSIAGPDKPKQKASFPSNHPRLHGGK